MQGGPVGKGMNEGRLGPARRCPGRPHTALSLRCASCRRSAGGGVHSVASCWPEPLTRASPARLTARARPAAAFPSCSSGPSSDRETLPCTPGARGRAGGQPATFRRHLPPAGKTPLPPGWPSTALERKQPQETVAPGLGPARAFSPSLDTGRCIGAVASADPGVVNRGTGAVAKGTAPRGKGLSASGAGSGTH